MTTAPVSTRFDNDVTIPAKTATRVRSKSETPKSKREPYVPAKLLKPSATDYYKTADYIDQQAAMGFFNDTKPYTVQVAHYIWRHTVRKMSQGLGPNEKVGFMMTGKCNRAKIATECYLSLSSVDRALDALEDASWIRRIRGKGNDLSIGFTLTHPLTDESLLSDRQEGTVPQTGGVQADRQDNTGIFTGIPTSTTTEAAVDAQGGEAPSGQEIDRDSLANALGLSSVDSLAGHIISRANSLAATYSAATVLGVAQTCGQKGDNPPGLFFRHAEDMCKQLVARDKADAQERAVREAEAVEAEARAEAARSAQDIAKAECDALMGRYAAQWYTSEPKYAHANAVRETSKHRNPIERLDYMQRKIASFEANSDAGVREAFLAEYNTWSVSRAA